MLRKGVCPYRYIDYMENFDETFPEKTFYGRINVENITDSDCKRWGKNLGIF